MKNTEKRLKRKMKKQTIVSEKKFTKEMGEISGFGGSYEATCRKMLLNAVKYFEEHPDCNPIFKGFEGVYGLMMADNEDAKALNEAIMEGIDDATGMMHEAVVISALYIKKHGWDKYVDEMSRRG